MPVEKADAVTLRRVPLAPVESALSLPAKSTKLILLTYLKDRYRFGVQYKNEKDKNKEVYIYISCTELQHKMLMSS